jgi:hypothetical protein
MQLFALVVIVSLVVCIACCTCGVAHAEEAMPAEFFTWDRLGTYAGAAALVALVTQLTKNLPYISKIPTQVWSYILAVLVLIASQVFTGALSASSAALSLANGVLVSLASNGGYSLITRVKGAAEGQ